MRISIGRRDLEIKLVDGKACLQTLFQSALAVYKVTCVSEKMTRNAIERKTIL